MKKTQFLTLLLGATLLASCTASVKQVEVRSTHAADSTDRVDFTFTLDLPAGADRVSSAIRGRLMDLVDEQLGYIGSYEHERSFAPYPGRKDDTEAFADYYRTQARDYLTGQAQAEYDGRAAYIMDDDELSPEEKQAALSYDPRWEYDFSMTKLAETERYVLFQSQNYVYMGGAHGGVNGAGVLTFAKRDGHEVTAFLQEGSAKALQPLLRKGLTEYLSGDGSPVKDEDLDGYLFIEDGIVPLPAWAPYPAEEGLCFVYQQYEITPYAMGMPSFILPYGQILPFLTEDARQVLGLDGKD